MTDVRALGQSTDMSDCLCSKGDRVGLWSHRRHCWQTADECPGGIQCGRGVPADHMVGAWLRLSLLSVGTSAVSAATASSSLFLLINPSAKLHTLTEPLLLLPVPSQARLHADSTTSYVSCTATTLPVPLSHSLPGTSQALAWPSVQRPSPVFTTLHHNLIPILC